MCEDGCYMSNWKEKDFEKVIGIGIRFQGYHKGHSLVVYQSLDRSNAEHFCSSEKLHWLDLDFSYHVLHVFGT